MMNPDYYFPPETNSNYYPMELPPPPPQYSQLTGDQSGNSFFSLPSDGHSKTALVGVFCVLFVFAIIGCIYCAYRKNKKSESSKAESSTSQPETTSVPVLADFSAKASARAQDERPIPKGADRIEALV
ncbi:hypothetical protein CCACVL1_12506 [Corchorus capsularis]|uniref:Uncharacterized protein n=1 Tax=Corchorus capsularis TaxID=210143 RepID=A0A1R3IFB1_COCAP|nr:hypothetical protein CCACVL1_12506 [Corchorus capsularis]